MKDGELFIIVTGGNLDEAEPIGIVENIELIKPSLDNFIETVDTLRISLKDVTINAENFNNLLAMIKLKLPRKLKKKLFGTKSSRRKNKCIT
jgi:hypothetical protein